MAVVSSGGVTCRTQEQKWSVALQMFRASFDKWLSLPSDHSAGVEEMNREGGGTRISRTSDGMGRDRGGGVVGEWRLSNCIGSNLKPL